MQPLKSLTGRGWKASLREVMGAETVKHTCEDLVHARYSFPDLVFMTGSEQGTVL